MGRRPSGESFGGRSSRNWSASFQTYRTKENHSYPVWSRSCQFGPSESDSEIRSESKGLLSPDRQAGAGELHPRNRSSLFASTAGKATYHIGKIQQRRHSLSENGIGGGRTGDCLFGSYLRSRYCESFAIPCSRLFPWASCRGNQFVISRITRRRQRCDCA